MKGCFVTGGTGFIGSRVVLSLINDGWTVFASKRDHSDFFRLGDRRNEVRWLSTHELSPRQMLEQCDNLQGVIHIATLYGRKESAAQVVENNILWPLHLLEASIELGITTFVHTDTCYSTDYPFLQNYTLSKKQMVSWGNQLSDKIQFVNLRLFHPIGVHDHPDKFIPWIVHQCRQNIPKIALTSGSQRKDFIDVDDVAMAYLTVLNQHERLDCGFSEIDCGRGNAISVRELVELIHRQSGSRSILEFGALPTRENEPEVSEANTEILKTLGWVPRCSLETAVEKILRSHE